MNNPAESRIDEPRSASHRVVLLAGADAPLARALALALAAQGHSLILWDAPAMSPEGTLGLQLEIERAGGISLAAGGEGLADAADAFGRIDSALAPSHEAARRIAQAAAPLERRLRPGRLLIARRRGEGAGQPISPAPRDASVDGTDQDFKLDRDLKKYEAVFSEADASAPPRELIERIAAFLIG